MKNLRIGLFLIFTLSFCKKSNNVAPNSNIVGVWAHAYQQQTLQQDGTWSEWQTINTFAALPSYEFTKKGRFLLDGKISETCCWPGSKYSLIDKTLTFEYEVSPDCRYVKCADANTKTIELLDEKNLILIESSGRVKNRYLKVK